MKQINTIKLMRLSVLSVLMVLFVGLSARAQLNGTYTVYGTGANYPNLEAAANALSAGVSGPVVFKIRPGNWSSSSTSDATINNVSGASATNTITFEAENGDASTTIITNTNTSSSTSSNFIFRFNSAKYVRVRNLTLNKTYSTRGRCLYYVGAAQYNIVENCVLKGTTSSTTSNSNARVYATSMKDGHHNVIKNNVFDRGSYGIYWRGNSSSSSNLSPDNEFTGNTFNNCKAYSIYTYYTKNQKINNNTINTTLNSYHYAIYCAYGDGNLQVKDNSGSLTGKTSTTCGLYINYCDGSSTSHAEVTGNSFTLQSSSTVYPIYNRYNNWLTFDNNTVTATTTSTGTMYWYISYSGANNTITNNKISLQNRRGFYFYGAYSSANCTMTGNEFTQRSTDNSSYYCNVYGMRYSNNSKFNNNKVSLEFSSTSSSSSAMRFYWTDNSDDCQFMNNEITEKKNYTSGYYVYNYWGYYSDDLQFKNNKIDCRGSINRYWYTYFNYYGYDVTFEGNEVDIEHTRSGSSIYSVYNYFYGYGTSMVKNNKINSTAAGGYAYGMYINFLSGGDGDIEGNEIVAKGGYGAYGLYAYYPQGSIKNNAVYAKASTRTYALMCYYPNNAKVYNNTVHNAGTSGTIYGAYIYMYGAQYSMDFYNNSISKSSSNGYVRYVYATNPDNYHSDYNNLYQPSGSLYYNPYTGANYSSIAALRAGTGDDMNSLSYMPGFMNVNNGDLRPDPSNPNSWALNGRGVQMTGNDKDINGNARALTTIAGVPDLGAYEFTPTATPPNCAMAPAAPPVNGTQVVTFGQDTVAVLNWGNTVPTGFAVKQYTGTNPPGITSINPTQMFYYVDFQGSGTNLDYEQDLYFKDPWLGSIASKSALRLAEKVGSSGWSGYSPSVSSANVVRNFIHTPSVQDVGALFTGIDVSDNASVDAILEPVPPFCPGTYTVKIRVKNNGNNKINSVKIDWQIDGGAVTTINHTTPIDINGSSSGNEATITLGNVAFGKAGVNVKAWTYLPNNVQDPVPGDDTLEQDYFASLSGTYTVGGATPDFPTVLAAINALNQYGTCGDVVFDVRPGVYTGQVVAQNPISASNTTDHITFQAVNGNPNSTAISYSASGTGDLPTLVMDGASNFTFRDMGIIAANNNYGTGIEFLNKASNDSFVGCRIAVGTATSSYNRGVWNSGQANCNYNSFIDCDIEGGYYSFYWYTTTSPYSKGLTIDGCTMNPYYYGTYIYYSNEANISNNTVTARQPGTSYYGILLYARNTSNNGKTSYIMNNKVVGFRGYSMYLYYLDGTTNKRSKVMNNSVITASNTTCYYPMLLYYPSNCDVMNNTLVNNGTNSSSYYGAYLYLSSYPNNKVFNNVFANLAGGYAANISYSSGYGTEVDYNNLYTTSKTQFVRGNTTASSLTAWRATGNDKHSVTYDPVITSNTNPAPDPQNPGVWALNGHAIQIAGNDKDINGNPRIDKLVDGVPDIGAYEVLPEVAPPFATANPATADKGDTQVFTFAGNEVGRITWGLTAPTTPVTVQQYSGEKGTGVAAAAAPSGSMYFHTDVKPVGNGTTFDFDFNLDYMDIWMGDISAENKLRLAHRVDGYPWMVYSGSLSTVDIQTNDIDAQKLNRFGSYTGLENGSIASAFVRPQSSTVICIGNSVLLDAEPQSGDHYAWYRNGNPIANASGPNVKTYLATQPGDYSVVITFSGKTVESVPVTVSTIAPPNALISANGPLTYCTGNGLTLDAGNINGVTYQWQLNGNDIPGANGNTYPVNQAGNYTVVVTNIGCSSTSTQTAVSAGPLTVDLGNDTSYCEIKNVFMKLDAGYPGAKYLWSTGDTTRTIEVKKGGVYTVQVDGGPNCVGTDAIAVTIDPLPKANGISFVQNGNTYQFFPSGPVGASGFLWLFSDGTSSTQNTPTKTITGDLYVRLVMFNACGSDTVQLGWPLSVQSVVDEQSVSVYPNPAKDRVTVSVKGAALETVEILNSVGSVVYRTEVSGSTHDVDVSGLANGHYMLRAVTGSGTISKQFDILK